tara:strand:+ start:1684 stop:5172 length:3489 start_codon:yes stop_codon:yes gene_type:complete
MATYVPGVGSYLPDFKPFTPDYKFLSNVLDTKTQKYESNYKALNDLYGKVVYGNLSRKDTQEMRDQYAENLAPKLQQIAGLDLSMAQNVDSAKALFRPFFEEDLIVKDLVQTKKYRNEMSYANRLKNSMVDEERQKYWQTGVQKMQFEMEDFVDASQDAALTMATPTYTPNANLYEKALEVLNESGLETDVVTTISENGEWMIHRKNGDLITNEALALVQKTLKDDPMVIGAYHADAYVKSRNFAQAGVDEGKFASIDQGQNVWATDKIQQVEAEIEKRQAALAEKKKQAQQKNEAWNQSNKQDPIIKGSPEEKASNESKSDLSAVRERLAEIDKLYDNQPQSEKDFKTNGEYNAGNTKSLLNRAYTLMMNMGMETDLQSAAIDYSKKGMMSKLEANEYAVLAKRHKYDMQKVAAQHSNKMKQMQAKDIFDKQNIALKAQLEYEATGQDKLDLEGSEITTDANTVTAQNIDPDGNATINGDHIENQEKVALGMQNKITNGEIDWTIDVLARKQGLTNGGSGLITMDGIGTMSASALKTELKKYLLSSEDNEGFNQIKSKYSTAFESEFKRMGDLVKVQAKNVNQETFSDNSPLLFNSKDPIAEFAAIQNGYDALDNQSKQLDKHISNLYEVTDYNIKKAVNSSFDLESGDEFKSLMAKAVNAGMPTMIYKDEDGTYRRHTDGSYKDAYWKWIQDGGGEALSVGGVDVSGFDDSSWITHHSSEHSQLGDGTMADLGQGKEEETYAAYSGTSGGGISSVGTNTGTDSFNNVGYRIKSGANSFENNRRRSDKQAAAFMKSMYELNDYAIRGKLEATQQVTTEKGDFAEFGDIFKTYDIKQGMRGIAGADQNAGEIGNNPTYEVLIDPLAISDSAAEQLNTLNRQVKNDPEMTIMLADYGFNEISKSDGSKYWDDGDVIKDKDKGSDNINYDIGKKLYNQYIMDMTKRRTTESKAQGDYPIATIKYFPSWTAEGKNLDHEYAGYTLTFSDEYLDGMRGNGKMIPENFSGNTLSFIIPKKEDNNPRKHGEFNFSYVASSIASSEDASFQRAVPAGGSFSITEGTEGGYNMNYQILQFNGDTGEYDAAQFTKQLVNDEGMAIGQGSRQELDYYMRKYLYELQKIGSQNKSQRDKWKKTNPDKITDPKEGDNFNFMFGKLTPEQVEENS